MSTIKWYSALRANNNWEEDLLSIWDPSNVLVRADNDYGTVFCQLSPAELYEAAISQTDDVLHLHEVSVENQPQKMKLLLNGLFTTYQERTKIMNEAVRALLAVIRDMDHEPIVEEDILLFQLESTDGW